MSWGRREGLNKLNKFQYVQGRGSRVRSQKKMRHLCQGPVYGRGPGFYMGKTSVGGITDTYDWKHYLPQTMCAGNKNITKRKVAYLDEVTKQRKSSGRHATSGSLASSCVRHRWISSIFSQKDQEHCLCQRNGCFLFGRGRVWVHHLSLSSGQIQNGDFKWWPLPIFISAVADPFFLLFVYICKWVAGKKPLSELQSVVAATIDYHFGGGPELKLRWWTQTLPRL